MKSRITMWTIAATLSAALAMPIVMAAQDNPTPDHRPRHQQYRLIDLGTLGGPVSLGPGVGNGGPLTNGRGAFMAQSETTVPLNPNSNGFPCFPGPNVNHALLWQHGHSSDLGALPPADNNCSVAQGINERGVIVGVSENGVIDPLLSVTEIRAVIWEDDRIIDLGTFGGNESMADSINNRGQVVGFALNAIPDPFSIFDFLFAGSSNGTQTRAFLWENGRMRDLGTLGGPDASAFNGFVNDRGQIAGWSYTNSTPNPTTGIPTLDPFLWDNGRMIDLGSLGGTIGLYFGLNNHGQVVGISNLPGDNFAHGFLWDRGKMKDLGTFGGDTSEADSLNEAGDVVGVADFPGDQLHDGVLWRNGRMIDLGNLGKTSHASSINSSRQIVGNSRLGDGITVHSFLWESGGPMVDLNDLVSPRSDVVLLDVNFITDDGKIEVNGLPPGCTAEEVCGHAYVLLPNGDCDSSCEQKLAESEGNRTAAAQPARSQTPMYQPSQATDPIERVRSMMGQRFHVPGARPVPRD